MVWFVRGGGAYWGLRDSWGCIAHHAQAWDITFTMDDLEESSQAANELWQLMSHRQPLMGPHDMLNWNHRPWIILEYVNSQTLKDLQMGNEQERTIDWAYLVCPGMAVVAPTGGVEDLTTLEACIEKIKKYNSRYKMLKASEGGFNVERVVLSKCLMNMPGISSHLKGPKNKVYWERERNQMRDPKNYVQQSRTSEAQDNTQVQVQLNNFHYTPDRNFIKKILEDKVSPFIIDLLRSKMVISPQEGPEILTWVPSQHINSWRLLTPRAQVANHLCTVVVERAVELPDMKAHMQFKSTFHKLAKTAVQTFLASKAIQDIESNEKEHEVGEALESPMKAWAPTPPISQDVLPPQHPLVMHMHHQEPQLPQPQAASVPPPPPIAPAAWLGQAPLTEAASHASIMSSVGSPWSSIATQNLLGGSAAAGQVPQASHTQEPHEAHQAPQDLDETSTVQSFLVVSHRSLG